MTYKNVIYILINPSFEDYIKIGYADDLDKRLAQLNRSECCSLRLSRLRRIQG